MTGICGNNLQDICKHLQIFICTLKNKRFLQSDVTQEQQKTFYSVVYVLYLECDINNFELKNSIQTEK